MILTDNSVIEKRNSLINEFLDVNTGNIELFESSLEDLIEINRKISQMVDLSIDNINRLEEVPDSIQRTMCALYMTNSDLGFFKKSIDILFSILEIAENCNNQLKELMK